MKRKGGAGQIEVKAVAFSHLVQSRELKWQPPMRELLQDPSAADFVWRRLQYVFPLPDPATFPAVDLQLEPGDEPACRRFVAQARDLAGTSLMSAKETLNVTIPDQPGEAEVVETDFSAKDITAGFMVLFRQCYSHDDEASFLRVAKALGAALHRAGRADLAQIVKQWRKAQALLRRKTLEELVQEQLIEDGQMPARSQAPNGSWNSNVVRPPDTPHNLLTQHWYGDQIHWGSHREAISALSADPFKAALSDFTAREAAADLAHIYLGFAVLVERALGFPGESQYGA